MDAAGPCSTALSPLAERARTQDVCRDRPGPLEAGSRSRLFLDVRLAQIDLFEVERELRLFIAQRIILAEGISFPILRHQDSTRIGMPDKLDAEHIQRFPFAPVCNGEDLCGRRQFWVVPTDPDPQLDREILRKGGELVDDMEAWFLLRPIIHNGHRREECKFLLIPQKG